MFRHVQITRLYNMMMIIYISQTDITVRGHGEFAMIPLVIISETNDITVTS